MNFCDNEALKIDYINGTLGSSRRRSFEDHMQACAGCREDIRQLASLLPPLTTIDKPSPPVSLVASTAALLKKEADPTGRRFVLSYILTTASVFATTFLLIYFFRLEAVRRWFSSLFGSYLSGSRAMETIGLFISLLSLLFIPFIIENIYILSRKKKKLNGG